MGAHHRRDEPGAAMERPAFDQVAQGYDPRQVDDYLGVLWRYASEVTSRMAAAESALRHERDRREAEARLAGGASAQAGGRIGLMLEIAQREADDIIAGARQIAQSALEEAVAEAGANHPIVREAREQAEKLLLDAVEESRRLALARHEDVETEIARGTHSLEALRRQQGEIVGAVLRLRRLLGEDEIDRAVTDLVRAGLTPDGLDDAGPPGTSGGGIPTAAPGTGAPGAGVPGAGVPGTSAPRAGTPRSGASGLGPQGAGPQHSGPQPSGRQQSGPPSSGSEGAGAQGPGAPSAGYSAAGQAEAAADGWRADGFAASGVRAAAAGARASGTAADTNRRGPGRHRQQRDVPDAEPYPVAEPYPTAEVADGYVPAGTASAGAGAPAGPVPVPRMTATGYRSPREDDILDAEIVED
ncbi:hypothetical protein [Parafrankia sp. FMc2]|uniref:hypothetical protein n=1 Tax=Parafrankia sp. FMc2 TaxID=3233196 RepID=UPI0034D69403